MKTAILYVSVHRGNTAKVARAMAGVLGADCFDIVKDGIPDISEYELIGFASGAFYHKMHKKLLKAAKEINITPEQKAFLVCTCGALVTDYTKGLRQMLEEKGTEVLGSFQCLALDCVGPLALFGGMNKGRPNAEDIENAKAFALNLVR